MKNNNASLERLEHRLHYQFHDRALLERALTHRSKNKDHNERLEFLGDALLETIISDHLYRLRPEANEGDLTRLRATMVRGTTLALLAAELQLQDFIRVGSGELRTGGYQRQSTLADALEAIIAAIYIDSDSFTNTYHVVSALYQEQLAKLPEAEILKDAKTRLQEYLQDLRLAKPVYKTLSINGPDHDKSFEVCCCVTRHSEVAIGSSKKKAEQAAAQMMLKYLQEVAND